MNVIRITEEQFAELAETAVQDNSISSASLNILKSTKGVIIQSTSGDYLLISD